MKQLVYLHLTNTKSIARIVEAPDTITAIEEAIKDTPYPRSIFKWIFEDALTIDQSFSPNILNENFIVVCNSKDGWVYLEPREGEQLYIIVSWDDEKFIISLFSSWNVYAALLKDMINITYTLVEAQQEALKSIEEREFEIFTSEGEPVDLNAAVLQFHSNPDMWQSILPS